MTYVFRHGIYDICIYMTYKIHMTCGGYVILNTYDIGTFVILSKYSQ